MKQINRIFFAMLPLAYSHGTAPEPDWKANKSQDSLKQGALHSPVWKCILKS